MEETDILKISGMSAGTITIVLAVYRFLKSLKGKKFISSCCGRKATLGFDVAQMSPTASAAKISQPISENEKDSVPSHSGTISPC